VEAVDEQGNYRNFLNLQAAVVSPEGEKQTVRLEQTGPGHYEARFPTKQVGSYLLNLMDIKDGQLRGSQVVGASVNYSPEFIATEPNLNLLRRLAESGGGKILEPSVPTLNPFSHDRRKTFQPKDLWESLLKLAIVLFTLDVGVRRVQIDREEWEKLRRRLFFWQAAQRNPAAEESLSALLARREQVRTTKTAPAQPKPDLFRPLKPVTEETSSEPGTKPDSSRPSEPQPKQPSADAPAEPASTTSRLLEAKRRAQKRKDSR
jgi:Ca-activated chloride channel homolog